MGPVLSGVLHDLTGDYQLSLRVFTILALSAGLAALMFTAPHPQK